MRSKTPLALMEQAIMVLVFALAAALCLRVFVWSNETSKDVEARDRAAIEVQSVAEVIKNEGRSGKGAAQVLSAAAERLSEDRGSVNYGGASIELRYDSDWAECGDGEYTYVLRAREGQSDIPGLGRAVVEAVEAESGSTIFEITVAWQTEVGE